MKHSNFILSLISAIVAVPASATLTVQLFVNGSQVGTVTPTLDHSSGGISWWNVSWTHPSNSSLYTVRVRGASTDAINSLYIIPYSGGGTVLDVSAGGVNPDWAYSNNPGIQRGRGDRRRHD